MAPKDTAPPSPRVVVSYAAADREAVSQLVAFLERRGLDVWWDRKLEPGTEYRAKIPEEISQALCVVVVWTSVSVTRPWVLQEASLAMEKGNLVPVLLEQGVAVPLPFGEFHHADLSGFLSGNNDAAEDLVTHIKSLVNRKRGRPTRKSKPSNLLRSTFADYSTLAVPMRGAIALRGAVGILRSRRDVFRMPDAPVEDLRFVLGEVAKTYRAVRTAIAEFLAPAFVDGPLDPTPFLKIERGQLLTLIEEGRGHSSAINKHAHRSGLIGWLDRLEKTKFEESLVSSVPAKQVLNTVVMLGGADRSVFAFLGDIGHILTTEATAILNLMASGQDAEARNRTLRVRVMLRPIEEELALAVSELQWLQQELGFSEHR